MTSLRRRILDYSLAGLLLLLPVVILRSSLKEPEDLNGFDRAVLRVSSPLQSAVAWLIEGIGGAWQRYIWLVNVEEENDELRDEVVRLRQLVAERGRQVGDTQILEKALQLRDRTAAKSVGARVVAGTLNPYFRVTRISLDRSAKEEVDQGDPVVDPDGALVGRIHHAYGDYSDVLLVTDPDSWVSVQVVRTGKLGNLNGMATDDEYRCTLAGLRADDVAEGDIVVTSGLKGDFPAGLTVGTVSSVEDDPVDLFVDVTITPAVDFSRLSTVLVLTAQPPPPDPSEGKPAAGPTAAYGVVPQ
jgi:rod shape-determining protein MreC